MSYPLSKYAWVPRPNPIPQKPPSSTPDSLPPGLRRTGSRTQPRGRGLQATCTFPPGSAIAEFPSPLLAMPNADHVRTTCDWCLRTGPAAGTTSSSSFLHGEVKLSACTRCRYVVYCGKACQGRAWRAVHKAECPALRRARDSELARGHVGQRWLPTPVRAAMQVVIRLGLGDEAVREAFGDVPFVGNEGSCDVEGTLEGNVDGSRRDAALWADLGLQAWAALNFAGLERAGGADAAPEDMAGMIDGVRKVLCKIQTNAFDRRDVDAGAGTAGLLLDADLAMANHSCLPNAYVCFSGRKAILRAEREINEGEEIEISYTDNTYSKEDRHKALKSYHFECQCRRCREDLDVYQVCQSSPLIPLNILSLQPDLGRYKNPPIDRALLKKTTSPPHETDKHQLLRERYKSLIDVKMFAVQPLPSTLHELATRYETEEQNFAYALSLACFLATQCHPCAHVAPFEPWRVTELLVIAQLLSQTAPLSATGELAKTCPNAVLVDKLSKMDQVSMCEAILRLVAYYGPMAHSDDWEVTAIARELLDDIEKLEGRERESALVRAWLTNPERQDARAFVEEVVLMPINELGGFAVEILVNDMADDNGLVMQSVSQS